MPARRIPRAAVVAIVGILPVLGGCALPGTTVPTSARCSLDGVPAATAEAGAAHAVSAGGNLVIVGEIITLSEPANAEALLIRDGLVACVGARDEVLAAADDDVPVLDIGDSVAYPGFIDAHAHWIGDRDYFDVGTPAAAMEAALSRGWTSISEQWVDRERLAELEALAAEDALPIRVDAYLALNAPAPSGQHYGDWYAGRRPGVVTDHLRVQGLKITLDNGWGTIFHWESAELTSTIGRADDAGWQVSVHTVSAEAHDMVLDAFEAALGPDGPNDRHHRIEHAIQVTDEQLARMVAMDLATVIHLDGAGADFVLEADYLDHFGPGNPGEEVGWLTRWRDLVEAGLHVAAASDAPWIFPDLQLTDDIGRPMDQIAGGMDGRGRSNLDTPAWVGEQLLTAEQALRAVTVEGAWVLADDARRGHLAAGALGDVTILSGDVLAATPDEIRAMRVVATIVGGEVVYCSDVVLCGD